MSFRIVYCDSMGMIDGSDERKYYEDNAIVSINQSDHINVFIDIPIDWDSPKHATYKKVGPDHVLLVCLYLTKDELVFRDEIRDETKFKIPLEKITRVIKFKIPNNFSFDPLTVIFNKGQNYICIEYMIGSSRRNVMIGLNAKLLSQYAEKGKLERIYSELKQRVGNRTENHEEK